MNHVFQSRGQGLIKQLQERYDQIELTSIEKSTFAFLRDHESLAIPKRLQVS